MLSLFFIAVGVGLLYTGGEKLVESAGDLCVTLGVPPLVVGLTIVAFGTSSPELASTLAAAYRGEGGIVFGTIVGSNIANIGLILGVSAIIHPIAIAESLRRRDVPVLLGATTLCALFAASGQIVFIHGVLLIVVLMLYTVLLLRLRAGHGALEEEESMGNGETPVWRSALGVLFGVILLATGGPTIIEGALGLGELFGLPSRVMGLTVVALGSSLPELAVSVIAARRGQGSLAIGNIIGSNIFNVLCVLGFVSLVEPILIDSERFVFDVAVMLGVTALTALVISTQRHVKRAAGTALFVTYVGWVAALFLLPH